MYIDSSFDNTWNCASSENSTL